MKKQRSIYEGNKKIMEDEETYPDKNTIVLIDLIVDIIVKKTLTQLNLQGDNSKMPIKINTKN